MSGATILDGRPDRGRKTQARELWLHLCNGLDPRRDGGMVPSILGMTGALARRGEPVSIVTPTPCDLGPTSVPEGVGLAECVVELETAVRGADVLHLHGLWQAHTRRGAARRDAPTFRT